MATYRITELGSRAVVGTDEEPILICASLEVAHRAVADARLLETLSRQAGVLPPRDASCGGRRPPEARGVARDGGFSVRGRPSDAPLLRKSVCAEISISSDGSGANQVSSPQAKEISLVPSGKSGALIRPSRAHQEGRIAIVTNVGCGMRWTEQRN